VAGAAVTKTFASVNGAAAQPAKEDLGSFWDSLAGGSAKASSGASWTALPVAPGNGEWTATLQHPLTAEYV